MGRRILSLLFAFTHKSGFDSSFLASISIATVVPVSRSKGRLPTVTPVAGFVFDFTLPIDGLLGVSRAQC